MRWIVDKIPEQYLLNTAGWRFIIPQLYRKYPNDDMNLNISLSSAPVIVISEDSIHSTVYADLIIDVVEAGQIIPVACISLVSLCCKISKCSINWLCLCIFLNHTDQILLWNALCFSRSPFSITSVNLIH